MTRVLDAWALLALVRNEPSAARIERELRGQVGVISWINLGQVYYLERRRLGEGDASRLIDRIRGVLAAEEPDAEVVLEAAAIKAGGGLSYADCFAVATAARNDAPLLTGDPGILDAELGVEIVDLR